MMIIVFIDEKGNKTTYLYSLEGNLLGVIDALGNTNFSVSGWALLVIYVLVTTGQWIPSQQPASVCAS